MDSKKQQIDLEAFINTINTLIRRSPEGTLIELRHYTPISVTRTYCHMCIPQEIDGGRHLVRFLGNGGFPQHDLIINLADLEINEELGFVSPVDEHPSFATWRFIVGGTLIQEAIYAVYG